jgi:hypothetical protein
MVKTHFHGKGLAQHTLCILCLSVVILVLAGSFNFTKAAEEKNAERESSGRETERNAAGRVRVGDSVRGFSI